MIFGMSLATYTLLHVVISLIGIATGVIVLLGLIRGTHLPGWAAIFLVTTILTSVTGYGFPIHGLTPGHVVGAISLVALALAVAGLYRFELAGSWRRVYVVTSVLAVYLNVFVGIVQTFRNVPVLHAAAPTESEPPFAIAQLTALLLFVVMGYLAVRGFAGAPLTPRREVYVPK